MLTAARGRPTSGPFGPRGAAIRLEVDPAAWVAPEAVLVSRNRLAAEASVGHGCHLRGEAEPIEVGLHVLAAGVPARIRGEVAAKLRLRQAAGVERDVAAAAARREARPRDASARRQRPPSAADVRSSR